MHTIYRALTLAVAALGAVQVAALTWFVGGAVAYTDAGGSLSQSVMWGDDAPFVEMTGYGVAWFIGSVAMPVATFAVAIAAAVWRNELAILAGLALVGLAIAQALVLNGVIEGLGAPALQGAISVAIVAIAVLAPKGAGWAAHHREAVRAAYAHTPLPA